MLKRNINLLKDKWDLVLFNYMNLGKYLCNSSLYKPYIKKSDCINLLSNSSLLLLYSDILHVDKCLIKDNRLFVYKMIMSNVIKQFIDESDVDSINKINVVIDNINPNDNYSILYGCIKISCLFKNIPSSIFLFSSNYFFIRNGSYILNITEQCYKEIYDALFNCFRSNNTNYLVTYLLNLLVDIEILPKVS